MTIALTVIATLAVTLAVVQGGLLLSLRQSQAGIMDRVDRVTRRQAGTGQSAPIRRAPAFALPGLDGRIVSLAGLLAAGRPALLAFSHPKCGPCHELLADTGGWERVYGDRLSVVTISSGDVRQNRILGREYGLGTILLQQDRELADALELPMLPAAVLVAPDGRVLGSATGAYRVRELVASALGLAVPPPAQAKPVRALEPGEPVGDLRWPDLDGTLVNLGEPHPDPALLLFWSPGCSHCQDLLQEIRAWDADPSGPRMVVVTSGPAGLNREAGLLAPMIPDDEGVLKHTFGVRGTPAAVLIDGNGRVASGVARGATAVRALAAQRFATAVAAD